LVCGFFLCRWYYNIQPAGDQNIDLVGSSKIGQDIWINARDWDELDTGFRGLLHRFTMHADALTPESINASVTSDLRSGKLNLRGGTPERNVEGEKTMPLWYPAMLFLLFVIYVLRQRTALRQDLPGYVNSIAAMAKRTRWSR